jgi:hypothetical protein
MGRVGGVWSALAGFGVGVGGWVVEAHSWSSLLLPAVREWDHVGASRKGKCGFFAGFGGIYFLFLSGREVRAEG